MLRNGGADVDAKSIPNNLTPLNYAVLSGHAELSEILLQYGSDANSMGNRAQGTPLHCATEGRHYEVAKILLKYGAKMNLESVKGCQWVLT